MNLFATYSYVIRSDYKEMVQPFVRNLADVPFHLLFDNFHVIVVKREAAWVGSGRAP